MQQKLGALRKKIYICINKETINHGANHPTKLQAMRNFNEIIADLQNNNRQALTELAQRQEEFGLVHSSVSNLFHASPEQWDACLAQVIQENEWHMAIVFEQWAEA